MEKRVPQAVVEARAVLRKTEVKPVPSCLWDYLRRFQETWDKQTIRAQLR